MAHQLAAERSKSEGLVLRCIQLENELDIAAVATTVANQRAKHTECAKMRLEHIEARAAADAANTPKRANECTQEYAKSCSATSASNHRLQQLLGKKGRALVAALTELDTTRRMLSDTRNEPAAERHAASERANANTRRGVDAGQQTGNISCRQHVSSWRRSRNQEQLNIDHLAEANCMIEFKYELNKELHDWNDSLQTQKTGLELYLEIMTDEFEDEQKTKKSVIRQVRDWIKGTESRCVDQVERWDLGWQPDRFEN
ncbi:hypothetical protein H4R19_004638 [Coemansia spiralis]|nr:hypothetical protein H4R19_004638 [Coemansia spiralis]